MVRRRSKPTAEGLMDEADIGIDGRRYAELAGPRETAGLRVGCEMLTAKVAHFSVLDK